MKLSQREKYIAMGVGAAILLFALNEIVISPYFDKLKDITKQIDDGENTQRENANLFENQNKLARVWDDIKPQLKTDDSEAETQALDAALTWATDSGVVITAVKPERITPVGDFEVIGFHLTGEGNSPAMGRFLLAFESAHIPVRVDEMTLSPIREGTDNLKIELILSTLSQKPQAEATAAKNTVSDAHGIWEARPWNE